MQRRKEERARERECVWDRETERDKVRERYVRNLKLAKERERECERKTERDRERDKLKMFENWNLQNLSIS